MAIRIIFSAVSVRISKSLASRLQLPIHSSFSRRSRLWLSRHDRFLCPGIAQSSRRYRRESPQWISSPTPTMDRRTHLAWLGNWRRSEHSRHRSPASTLPATAKQSTMSGVTSTNISRTQTSCRYGWPKNYPCCLVVGCHSMDVRNHSKYRHPARVLLNIHKDTIAYGRLNAQTHNSLIFR